MVPHKEMGIMQAFIKGEEIQEVISNFMLSFYQILILNRAARF